MPTSALRRCAAFTTINRFTRTRSTRSFDLRGQVARHSPSILSTLRQRSSLIFANHSSGEGRPTSAVSYAPITLSAAFPAETADSSPVRLWSELGRSNGRYRNIRSVSRRPVYSGRLRRVLHRPRSQCARKARAGICTSRVAGGCRAHNGRRNMVDALRRHARVYHADTPSPMKMPLRKR